MQTKEMDRSGALQLVCAVRVPVKCPMRIEHETEPNEI